MSDDKTPITPPVYPWSIADFDFSAVPPYQSEALKSVSYDDIYPRAALQWARDFLGEESTFDMQERGHRFLEEALELVQSIPSITKEQVLGMVEYVFSRPIGKIPQEIGGAMHTLAVLAGAYHLNLTEVAWTELKRAQAMGNEIAEKCARKPRGEELEALGRGENPKLYDYSTPLTPKPPSLSALKAQKAILASNLVAENRLLRSALDAVSKQFAFYTANHVSAGKLDKARTNGEWAAFANMTARGDAQSLAWLSILSNALDMMFETVENPNAQSLIGAVFRGGQRVVNEPESAFAYECYRRAHGDPKPPKGDAE